MNTELREGKGEAEAAPETSSPHEYGETVGGERERTAPAGLQQGSLQGAPALWATPQRLSASLSGSQKKEGVAFATPREREAV